MNLYEVQCCYKQQDGSLAIYTKTFEADNADKALQLAKKTFDEMFPFSEEKMYSTAKATDQKKDIHQRAKFNITLGSVKGMQIGDTYIE